MLGSVSQNPTTSSTPYSHANRISSKCPDRLAITWSIDFFRDDQTCLPPPLARSRLRRLRRDLLRRVRIEFRDQHPVVETVLQGDLPDSDPRVDGLSVKVPFHTIVFSNVSDVSFGADYGLSGIGLVSRQAAVQQPTPIWSLQGKFGMPNSGQCPTRTLTRDVVLH